jgi:hypothetical protein
MTSRHSLSLDAVCLGACSIVTAVPREDKNVPLPDVNSGFTLKMSTPVTRIVSASLQIAGWSLSEGAPRRESLIQ